MASFLTNRGRNASVPWRKPDLETDPAKLTCETTSCPYHGRKVDVIGVWDQPPTFVDPSTLYLLWCGCEAL